MPTMWNAFGCGGYVCMPQENLNWESAMAAMLPSPTEGAFVPPDFCIAKLAKQLCLVTAAFLAWT